MKYIDIELDGKQVRIPEFAYEESIQQIAKILKEQLRVAAGDTKLISKILREGNKAQKEATKKAHQQQAKEDARQKNADKEELKTQKKILQEQSKGNSKLVSAVEKMASPSGTVGNAFSNVFGSLGKFTRFLNVGVAALVGLVHGVTTAFKFLMKLGRLEASLFRGGFFDFQATEGVANGIASLGVSAAKAGMTIEEAAEYVTQYSKAVDVFGTTLFDASNVVQKTLDSQGLLGLSVAELNEQVGEQAELFRRMGIAVEADGQNLADHTVEVLRVTQQFSSLTKVSADVIRSMVAQASVMASFTNRMRMLPEFMRQNSLKSAQVGFAGLAAFGPEIGGQLSSMLSQGIGRGTLAFDESARQLLTVSPRLYNSLENLNKIISGGGGTDDVAAGLDAFRENVIRVGKIDRRRLQALEIAGVPMADAIIKLSNLSENIDVVTNDFKEMARAQAELKPGELAQVQSRLSRTMTILRVAFNKLALAFLTDGVIDAIEKFGNYIADLGNKLANFISDPNNGIFGMINKIMNGITKFMSGMFHTAAGAIGAQLNRSLAEKLPTGMNKEKLAQLDVLRAQYNNVQQYGPPGTAERERRRLLHEMLRLTGNTSIGAGNYTHGQKMSEDGMVKSEYMAEAMKILNADSGQYYASNKVLGPGSQIPASDFNIDGGTYNGQGSAGVGSSARSRSKIRIMPMFGDAQSYVNQEKKPEDYLKEIAANGVITQEQLATLIEHIKKSNTNIQTVIHRS